MIQIILLSLLFSFPPTQENANESLSGLGLEITRFYTSENATATAIWWPTEFFEDALLSKRKYSPEERRKAIELFQNVNVFAIVAAETGEGDPSYLAPERIPEKLRLKDPEGKEYAPLALEAIPLELRAVTASIRPSLGATLGAAGKNFAIVYFPGRNAKGARLLDPKTRGKFSLTLRDFPKSDQKVAFRWELPLDSLFPSKTCAKCKENCRASWSYCPWDGTKL